MSDIKARLEEKKKKLHELHRKRNEARQLNHHEVVEEDKRSKLPKNWEARKARAEWTLADEEGRRLAKEKGEDYDRKRLLNVPADLADKLDKKKMRKKNPDLGFSDFEQAAIRKYNRLINNHKVDIEAYNRQKEFLGPNMMSANPVLLGLQKDTKDDINAMAQDIEKQISKRDKYSRRRTYNDEADIDYINERNMKFNKKLERFYGEHTLEIKQNLERGTAV